jgi:hypothetical protein
MNWQTFAAQAPELAALGRARMDAAQVVLLGTLRKDGSPRITPIEYFFFEGQLTIGGMWQSKKMTDLLRDPRCTIHSAVTSKEGVEGDFKLAGRAIAQEPGAFRDRYLAAYREATGWAPSEPFHLFSIDVHEAAFLIFESGVASARDRLAGSPGIKVQTLAAGPTSAGYLVATWKAA